MTKSPPPLWTKEGRQDPPAWYRYMREHEPVTYHEEIDAYGLFRYEDIRQVFLDDVNWSVERRFDSLPEDQRDLHLLANTLNGIDPPEHKRVRTLAMPSVAPNQIAKLEPMVQEICAELLDALVPRGRFDFANEFAHPFVQMVINSVVGIPREDYLLSKGISDRMEKCSARFVGGPFSDPDELRKINQEYRDYFAPIIEARRHCDHGDVMSKLVQAEQEGDRLSTEELFKMAMIFNRGGADTTMTGITQMLRLMIEYPDQYQKVREDRSLAASAVDECLRFYPPSHSMSRVATHDVTIDGMTIPAGKTVLLWLPSGNRDPAAFPDPERFDVTRRPNRHLSLGLGIHVCIGMHLARLEMRVALEQWMDRVESFERAETGPIPWNQNTLIAVVPLSFPVNVTPAVEPALSH
jgi:cytochrome P450